MAKQYKVTAERLEELKNELEYLKTTRTSEVEEQIKEARAQGDLSENAEYDEAKNEQGKLYSRIAELESIINNAVLIDENVDHGGEVRIGCKVQVKCKETGEENTFTIVGTQESDPFNGLISDESPVGHALIGKREGTTAEVKAISGVFHYKIVKIANN